MKTSGPDSCVPSMEGVGERGWDPGDLKQQFQSKCPWEGAVFTHAQLLLTQLRECNRSQRGSQAARYPLPGLDCISPGRVSNLCVWLKYSESTVTRDLGPGSLQSRDGAWARGWSILNSNWLEASWFITGKERPGTYSDLELFHCSFPGAGSPPPPPPRSVPGGNGEYEGIVWSL